MNKDIETTREQVWLAAWIAYATASNSTKKEGAAKWADQCLSDFDERFPQKQNLDSSK